MNKAAKICIVGSTGTLGYAICNQLRNEGYNNILCCDLPMVDCTSQMDVQSFFNKNTPEYVFFLAATSVGIKYKKKYPVEVLLQNLQMATNVISACHDYNCKRLLNVCSALLYPSTAQLPLREEDVTFTNLNEVDTPYSLAKATSFQLCQYYSKEYQDDFFTVVPCNFFGARASFEGDRAGVVPSLIRRIHEAKENALPNVTVWGTGNACREFLNSKDVASACICLMKQKKVPNLVNIGRGKEYTIRETAETIKHVIGYKGELIFDRNYPEGRQHMLLDTEKLFGIGWRPTLNLKDSIEDAYNWYISNRRGKHG